MSFFLMRFWAYLLQHLVSLANIRYDIYWI